MPEQFVPREEGILYKIFQNQGAGRAYQRLDPRQRLDLMQNAMRQGQQPSEQDSEILQRLRAMQESQNGPQNVPQLAAPDQNQGFLSSLFQFISGREPVDPLEALKQPGYSGPASR
jgi:hypothetical protein